METERRLGAPRVTFSGGRSTELAGLLEPTLLRVRRCLPPRMRRALEEREQRQLARSRQALEFLQRPSRALSSRSSFDSAQQGTQPALHRRHSDLLPLPLMRQATSDPTPSLPGKDLAASSALSRLRTTAEPYSFTFLECSYQTHAGHTILHAVSGLVSSGHVLAVLGPSGAGKTTLLSMLTLERRGGKGTGRIALGGQYLTRRLFTRHCAAVTQHDTHWPYLTGRDHLRLAVDCYRPQLSRELKREVIDRLLEATGLVGCQHTRAGSASVGGMSGGQRRRLTLALALAKQPAMIFLDEPTSGLDSAAAANIMAFLQLTARQANVPILCTVHQPSAAVFAGFGDVLIMSLGRVAYFGPAAQLSSYLGSIGKPLPPTANPAEYALDCINPDFSDNDSVLALLDAWRARAPPLKQPPPSPLAFPARRAGARAQFWILLRRHATLTKREPMAYSARLALVLGTNTFIALVYFGTRRRVQEQVLYRFYFFCFTLVVPLVFQCVVVPSTHAELIPVRREAKAGMYGPLAYVAASGALQLGLTLPLAIAALLPAYVLTDLSWASFPAAVPTVAAALLAYECLAQFCAHVPSALLGLILYLVAFLVTFVFCGLFIRQNAVHGPTTLLLHLNPLRGAYTAFTKLAFEASPPYSGAQPCPLCPIWDRVVGRCGNLPLDDQLQCDAQTDEWPRGFYCPGQPILRCFGISGDQILSSLHFLYDAADQQVSVPATAAAALLMAMILKGAHAYVLRSRCASGEPPAKPPARPLSLRRAERTAAVGQSLHRTGTADASFRRVEGYSTGFRRVGSSPSPGRAVGGRGGESGSGSDATDGTDAESEVELSDGASDVDSRGDSHDDSHVALDTASQNGASHGASHGASNGASGEAGWQRDTSARHVRRSRPGVPPSAPARPDPPPDRPSLDRLRAFGTPFELAFIDLSYQLGVSRAGRSQGGWTPAGSLSPPRRPPGFPTCLPPCASGRRRRKLLLRHVSACVGAGRVLAVLGPSGAGKTTLLSMLTLECGAGVPRGSVTLNGAPLTPAVFERYCAIVGQHDELWAHLSAADHLRYAVAMHRPDLDWSGREAQLSQLLDATGLRGCRHTPAGGDRVHGLSSGQRRRLSLALALAKQPAVLFLDEPTSGLDSAAAANIMAFLRLTAQTMNVAILCTVHQPSASVFAGFDDVLVLAAGRPAYFGPAADMGRYLESVGRPVPPNANPAEFMLNLVNQDFTDSDSVRLLLNDWARRAVTPTPQPPVRMAPPARRAGFCEQLITLCHRHIRLTIRSPMLYVARAGLNAGTMAFFCSVYLDSRNRVQAQVLNKAFFYFWMVAIPSSFSILAVYALGLELRVVLREVRNGMYTPTAFVAATSLLQPPMLLLVCLCGLLPAYAIIGPWGSFPSVLLVCAANLWAFECIAQLFSLVASPISGMLQCLALWVCSLLFCGLTIQGADILWPIRAFYYLLPLKWALSTAVYQVAIHCPDYTGTIACDVGRDTFCPSRGFLCAGTPDDPLGVVCFGQNSTQIMASLHHHFPAFSERDTMRRDLAAILLIGSAFKTVYAMLLCRRCRVGVQPEPPETRESV